jgi:hypothetical protein
VRDLFWVAVGEVRKEPGGSPEWAFGGKVWNMEEVIAGNFRGLLHPMRFVLDALAYFRPGAGEVFCLGLP